MKNTESSKQNDDSNFDLKLAKVREMVHKINSEIPDNISLSLRWKIIDLVFDSFQLGTECK